MANTHSTLTELFTDMADAIREKKGTSEPIIADNYPIEIENLRTGFDYINSDVIDIPDYAFYNCEELLSVDCYNLESIGANAFENCTRLKSIVLYGSVESIGEDAFKGCSDLTIYCMFDSQPETWNANWNPDNCEVVFLGEAVKTWDISATENDNVIAKLYNDIVEGYYRLIISGSGDMRAAKNPNSSAVIYWDDYKQNISSVIILNGAKNISYNAFRDCTALTSVTIPDSVTSIGGYAFSDCTSLASITIPDSVTYIGNYAFYNTEYYNNLSNWTNKVLYINNALIVAKTNISGNYVIKNGTTVITEYAFSSCTSLASITIPNSITSISSDAFNKCESLTSISIPDSVTSIGSSAFSGCKSLMSVNIPDSVTSIGQTAFYNCTSLISVTIPDSVTYIDTGVFSNCTSLMSVTIPDSVTSIGQNAFSRCTSLTSINIPNSVTSIGQNAFSWCELLISINIPDSVTNISNNAFYDCISLTSIEIPSSVTSIEYHTCANCTSLTSVTIPDSVTSIGQTAFYNCTSLISITFAGTVSQWNKIKFGYNWNLYTSDYTIYCTDGTITKSGTVTYN